MASKTELECRECRSKFLSGPNGYGLYPQFCPRCSGVKKLVRERAHSGKDSKRVHCHERLLMDDGGL